MGRGSFCYPLGAEGVGNAVIRINTAAILLGPLVLSEETAMPHSRGGFDAAGRRSMLPGLARHAQCVILTYKVLMSPTRTGVRKPGRLVCH